jgi:hydrogenase maturation protease
VSEAAGASAVLVVGLGNPLMADDGFGSAVVDALREFGPLPDTSAAKLPDVLHLLSVWRGQTAIWIVDAVAPGNAPGTVHRFDHDAVLELPAHAGSAHHLPFGASLRWLLHANPELRAVGFRLWGAEAARVSAGQGLSSLVAAAVGLVAQEIRSMATCRTADSAFTAHGSEI